MSRADSRRQAEGGFTLLELLITTAIIFILSTMAIPVYLNAVRQTESAAMLAECRTLYTAMMVYQHDNGVFPSEDDFDVRTFEPLVSEGYFRMPDSLTVKLLGGQLMLYAAPDTNGENSEFIAAMRSLRLPDVIAVVAHTTIISSSGPLDGVYVVTEQELSDAQEDL